MKMKSQLLSMVLISFGLTVTAHADDFSDLQQKEVASAKSNPFANRHSTCVTREGDTELKEIWNFLGGDKFTRKFIGLGLSQTGTYEVAGKSIKVHVSNGKDFDYKYKLTNGGYQYIHETKAGKKSLYTCSWMKEVIVDHGP